MIICQGDAENLEERVEEGRLLLFVRTKDAYEETKGAEIFSSHGAYEAKVNETTGASIQRIVGFYIPARRPGGIWIVIPDGCGLADTMFGWQFSLHRRAGLVPEVNKHTDFKANFVHLLAFVSGLALLLVAKILI